MTQPFYIDYSGETISRYTVKYPVLPGYYAGLVGKPINKVRVRFGSPYKIELYLYNFDGTNAPTEVKSLGEFQVTEGMNTLTLASDVTLATNQVIGIKSLTAVTGSDATKAFAYHNYYHSDSGPVGIEKGYVENSLLTQGYFYFGFGHWHNNSLSDNAAVSVKSIGNGPARLNDYFLDLTNKRIMLYGDSIFSEDYTWLKEALEAISGAFVYNGGESGANSAYLARTNIAYHCLNRVTNYDPDICFVMVGGNDTGAQGSVGTFGTAGGILASESVKSIPDITSAYAGDSVIEAACYIVNYITYHVCGFRHNAYTKDLCTDVGNTLSSETDLDGVRKPIVILCTTLPQQRTSASSAYSLPVNNLRKAEAMREISRLCNVPLLDLATMAGISRLNEPYWPGETDKDHNKGTLTMDGLHPNRYGYQRIAKMMLYFLSQYLLD